MRWRRDKAAEVLRTAEEIMLSDGPEAALRHLGQSECASTEAVMRRIHALVWINQATLRGRFLAESFLDPVWSQCDVCDQTWLIPPLSADVSVTLDASGQVGGRCPGCGRVICAGCLRLTETRCVCLADTVIPLRRPTGRKPLAEPASAGATIARLEAEAGISLPSDLYYHRFAWPIAVDQRFPSLASAGTDTHLRRACYLADQGMYVQAVQQLDLAGEPKAPAARGRACWLRARLELVQVLNRPHLPHYDPNRLGTATDPMVHVRRLLDDAVAADPDAGEIWLTVARANVHPLGNDPRRAVECARQARELLEDAPQALLGLSRALIAAGQADEAFTVARMLPGRAAGTPSAGGIPGTDAGDQEWLELIAPCGHEPPDPSALVRLGRRYLREDDIGSATTIFGWLTARCPTHAAGYAGLGRLALLDTGRNPAARLAKAYELCRAALQRDENCGFARETFGLIYSWSEPTLTEARLTSRDPIEFFREAAEQDPACVLALRSLAKDELGRGRLIDGTELLEQAAAEGTADAETYMLLAVIYLATGRFRDWRSADEKAQWLSPDIVLASEYTERILALCGLESRQRGDQ